VVLAGLLFGAVLGALALYGEREAGAFRYAIRFDSDPSRQYVDEDGMLTAGGAGNIYFTGSQRFYGLTCAVCHINAPGIIEIGVGSNPTGVFDAGYVPNTLYNLQVELLNEIAGTELNDPSVCPAVACNVNIFVLEVQDGLGQPAGVLCPGKPVPDPMTGAITCRDFAGHPTIAANDSAIFARGYRPSEVGTLFENGATSWDFYWQAPPAGTGPVTFYVVMVDGNGGAQTAETPNDPLGDDVRAVQITSRELFAAPGFP
jgi:hypothetical protein